MKNDNFSEALSKLGNEKILKTTRIKKTSILCGTIALFATALVTISILMNQNPQIDNSRILIKGTDEPKSTFYFEATAEPKETTAPNSSLVPEETMPFDAPAEPTETVAPAVTEEAKTTKAPGVINSSTEHVAKVPVWFAEQKLNIITLTYDEIEDVVNSFKAENFGANLINVDVLGEHKNCANVYYDRTTGKILCLYHEFLSASKISLNDECISFMKNPQKDNIFIADIQDNMSLRTKSLWMFDLSTGKVVNIPLSNESKKQKFFNFNIESGFYGDKILYSYINVEGTSKLVEYDIKNKSEKVILSYNNPDYEYCSIFGGYLTENVLHVSKGDKWYLYNVDTKVLTEKVGAFDYVVNGKIYSVNSMGMEKSEKILAGVYDANTGKMLENEKIILYSLEDGGKACVIMRDLKTGKDTVLMECVLADTFKFSNDYRYFYAISKKEKAILCYDVVTSEYFKVPFVDTELNSIVIRDGKKYEVLSDYSLALTDNPNEVMIYYKRYFDEIKDIPAYENLKVDSKYFDEYREIKFYNFPNDDTYGAGFVCDNFFPEYSNVWFTRSEEKVRDVILLLLANRNVKLDPVNGDKIDFYAKTVNGNPALHFQYGSAWFFMWKENGKYYCQLSYSLRLGDGRSDRYEITKEVFDEFIYILDAWPYAKEREGFVIPECEYGKGSENEKRFAALMYANLKKEDVATIFRDWPEKDIFELYDLCFKHTENRVGNLNPWQDNLKGEILEIAFSVVLGCSNGTYKMYISCDDLYVGDENVTKARGTYVISKEFFDFMKEKYSKYSNINR